jgi:hypothetical protein
LVVNVHRTLTLSRIASWSLAGAIAGSLTVAPPVLAANSATKPEFMFLAGQSAKIVVLKSDVSVAELTTGGLDQPKADWTKQAQAALEKAFATSYTERGLQIMPLPEMKGEDAKALSNCLNLLKIVSNEALTHKVFPGEALPTKDGDLLWSLGPGIAKLGEKIGADYAITFFSRDSYITKGRKAAETVSALLGEATSDGVHAGSMTMVDLKTGALVWMNVDAQLVGDIRSAEGARQRVEQLLRSFPASKPTPAPIPKTKRKRR